MLRRSMLCYAMRPLKSPIISCIRSAFMRPLLIHSIAEANLSIGLQLTPIGDSNADGLARGEDDLSARVVDGVQVGPECHEFRAGYVHGAAGNGAQGGLVVPAA
jgi:hypothetical protein